MSENSLLVIDDEPIIGYSFKRALAGEGVDVRAAQTAADGLRQFAERRPGVVVLDFQLPDRTGLEVFQEIHDRDPHVPVVLITAHGTTETAIEAMRLGVFDYLVKPVDLVGVKAVLRRAFEAGRLMQPASALPSPTGDRLLGRSAVIQEMCKLIGRAAPTDATVLILGESGTGKELVARAVYQHSRRAARPFLALNCAALPETLLESELFGHEKGAFTGADRRRVGRFEQCDGGTLFLDEIGDAPPAVQAKLLRVLQDRKFERLGGTETVAADVRLIAATNLNLADRVNAGAFRMDLYYRLRVVTVQVPALRDRRDDIPELASAFLYQFNAELGTQYTGLHPDALALLQDHAWPGNIRELQSTLKEGMLRGSGQILRPADIRPSLQGGPQLAGVPIQPPSGGPAAESPAHRFDVEAEIDRLLAAGEPGVYRSVLEQVERLLLARALQHTGGRQAQASDILGINRTTLRNRLRELNLTVGRVVMDEPE